METIAGWTASAVPGAAGIDMVPVVAPGRFR